MRDIIAKQTAGAVTASGSEWSGDETEENGGAACYHCKNADEVCEWPRYVFGDLIGKVVLMWFLVVVRPGCVCDVSE